MMDCVDGMSPTAGASMCTLLPGRRGSAAAVMPVMVIRYSNHQRCFPCLRLQVEQRLHDLVLER